MNKVLTTLDCGCAILDDGSRSWCTSCAFSDAPIDKEYELKSLRIKIAEYERNIQAAIELSRVADIGDKPVGWICHGRIYRVKQRDDAGFGDYYPDQYPVYAAPPQAQLQAAIDKARMEAAKLIEPNAAKPDTEYSQGFKDARGSAAFHIRKLIGKPLGEDHADK